MSEPWWSLNTSIAAFALPMLDKLIAEGTSYPATLNNREEWIEILKEIRFAFEAEVHENDAPLREEPPDPARKQNGLRLFSEHFENLWD